MIQAALMALFSGSQAQSAAAGEIIYEGSQTANTIVSWVCPAGVTSVSVVCVGTGGSFGSSGGGGGGGALAWKNNIPVVPGTSYTVFIPQPSNTATTGTYFISNTVVFAKQGGEGAAGNSFVGDGGGYGGTGGSYGAEYAGGGGAGGYSGNGGNGGSGTAIGNRGGAGTGGAAGGGSSGDYSSDCGQGGGVGLFGQGASGATSSFHGSAGSGGTVGTTQGGPGVFGGGAGECGSAARVGGRGAVRIMWGGGRTFPNNAAKI